VTTKQADSIEVATHWVVLVLRHWNSLAAMGVPLAMDQGEGLVGFLPAFDSLEAAVAWRGENHLDAAIVAIARVS